MNLDKSKLDGLKIDRGDAGSTSPGAPWIVGVAAVALVVLVAFWFLSRPARAAVEVATAQEAKGDGSLTLLNASGYVTARRQATVSSKVTGKVTEVLIEEGMAVREGQPLAKLDDSMSRRVKSQ